MCQLTSESRTWIGRVTPSHHRDVVDGGILGHSGEGRLGVL